jgi:hypothetical protein
MSYDVEAPSAARLWPYAPDWVRTFDVNRSYLTDIVTSRDNTEQRRALRDQPRLSATYQTTLSGSDRQAADHHMRAWQNEPVVVPDFARWARLTGSSSGGSSALTISPMPAWVAAGQPLVLCKSGVQEEVIVDSAGGSTINTVDPLVNAWASGDVLRPSFFGLFGSKLSSSRLNIDTASWQISVACYPGGEPPRDVGTAWASLNSIEVFTLEPDYVSPPSISDIWPVEEIDYGRGRTAQFRPVDRYARGAQYMFSGLDVATATELEQFFDRMKGRRTAFYLPTGEKDFTLAASAGSGASAFTASGSALASDFGSTDYSIVNEGVAVFLTDGSALYRRISDISASGGNSVVTVGSSWGVAISTANVARISRMPLTRFDADDMTTSWRTPLSASAQLPFLQVKA